MNKVILHVVKASLAIIFVAVTSCIGQKQNDEVKYLDKPVSYENGERKRFQIFQVITDDANVALATEGSGRLSFFNYLVNEKIVLLLGATFYDGQEVYVESPMQVGIYRYETKDNEIKTVPVVDVSLSKEEDKKSENNSEYSEEESETESMYSEE